MDRDECRFCQVMPTRGCPKLNGLSNQLIQYHYGEEFYFYFAKSINDIVRAASTPETIMYHSLCDLIECPDLRLKFFKKPNLASVLRSKFASRKGHRIEPLLVNHESWKIMHDNRTACRGQKSTEAGHSRRRRPAGLFPLRQGSLFGKLLPNEAPTCQKIVPDYQFADVGGSFCTKVFNIYSPSYSSLDDGEIAPTETRKCSVFLENRYEVQSKPKVPLLDIKRLVKNKSAGNILKSSGDFNTGTFSKANLQASTQNYSTQFSLEASRSRLLIPFMKSEENGNSRSVNRAKTVSRSKKKTSKVIEEKTNKKSIKRDDSKIKLNLNLKGSNPLIKNKSPKTIKGWSDFFHSKKSVGQILMSYRQKRSETKPSLIGNEMLSSRTAKEKASKGHLHARDSFARKSLVINYSSPRVNAASTKNLKYSLKIEHQSRPTLQLVKEQLAKLSGKAFPQNTKTSHLLTTVRSTSKKKPEPPLLAFTTSPILKLEKNLPVVMSHRMMPSMRLLKSSDEFNIELERSPKTQRLADPRKPSLGRSASKSTGRKMHPPIKKKSPSKDQSQKLDLFGRKTKKSGKKKPLLIAVNN
jgi:hypothetical protein